MSPAAIATRSSDAALAARSARAASTAARLVARDAPLIERQNATVDIQAAAGTRSTRAADGPLATIPAVGAIEAVCVVATLPAGAAMSVKWVRRTLAAGAAVAATPCEY